MLTPFKHLLGAPSIPGFPSEDIIIYLNKSLTRKAFSTKKTKINKLKSNAYQYNSVGSTSKDFTFSPKHFRKQSFRFPTENRDQREVHKRLNSQNKFRPSPSEWNLTKHFENFSRTTNKPVTLLSRENYITNFVNPIFTTTLENIREDGVKKVLRVIKKKKRKHLPPLLDKWESSPFHSSFSAGFSGSQKGILKTAKILIVAQKK